MLVIYLSRVVLLYKALLLFFIYLYFINFSSFIILNSCNSTYVGIHNFVCFITKALKMCSS